MTHFLCELGCESGILVTYDLVGESEVLKHLGDEEGCRSLGSNGLLVGDEQCGFGAVMVSNCQDGIVPM